MTKGRVEAFSDGVFAIIITIMVLELKVPHSPEPEALLPIVPVALSYLLSYVFLGIYWTNHHHLMQSIRHVSGGVLWANLHLLFWLSPIPFATAWTGENQFAAGPAALYGVVAIMWLIPDRRIEKKLVLSVSEEDLESRTDVTQKRTVDPGPAERHPFARLFRLCTKCTTQGSP